MLPAALTVEYTKPKLLPVAADLSVCPRVSFATR
jgi:hypothetical protein